MPKEERHPHDIAKLQFFAIVNDEKFSDEERAQAKLHYATMEAIINAVKTVQNASELFTPANPLCYMNACDLIEQFLLDPLQEQS